MIPGMILYYEAEEDVIAQILRRGFLAVLGSDETVQCYDCSLIGLGPADMPDSTPVPEGFAEIVFEVEADVSGHEVFPMDVPSGRHFRIPITEIDRMICPRRSTLPS